MMCSCQDWQLQDEEHCSHLDELALLLHSREHFLLRDGHADHHPKHSASVLSFLPCGKPPTSHSTLARHAAKQKKKHAVYLARKCELATMGTAVTLANMFLASGSAQSARRMID